MLTPQKQSDDDDLILSEIETYEIKQSAQVLQEGNFYTLYDGHALNYEGDKFLALTVLLRPALKRELLELSKASDMNIEEFVLTELKEKGLSVSDDDLKHQIINA